MLSPRSGSIVDPWTACNINYARIRIARAEKQDALWCASTRCTLRLFHSYLQRPQREIPHLRIRPYKEGVGTAESQMPLHVYSSTLLAALPTAHELLIQYI